MTIIRKKFVRIIINILFVLGILGAMAMLIFGGIYKVPFFYLYAVCILFSACTVCSFLVLGLLKINALEQINKTLKARKK